ncbi:MAG TPA: hypothetical protein PLI47_02455 [Bacteroidia bacterium]|nr:hypothetical protein [Bacteroidia bacterium]MBP9791150.1 hypothetical protein [Bacteroidia bacterium]MBP9923051.1 hypothetical protein [Bacteroidia bacterium]HQV98768.1 hypothetical protein [Bacteroidia bacterium]HQW22133.1 hypothetical protein [Bacteroidia bacterium]
MKSKALLLILFSFTLNASGQKSSVGSFWKLSCPEKWWVIGHPFVAGKAFKVTLEARAKSDSLVKNSLLDADSFGGKVDAFRHAYWMARLAQNMKWKKAVKLGIAHEKANLISFKKMKGDEEGVLPDSISSVMDLFNNQVGFSIGCNFKSASNDEIYNYVIKSLTEGKLKIVYKDVNRNDLDCDGKIVDRKVFFGKWNIPKCLVNSDFIY